jgi:predicted lipid-binding transport protein (Tim44 family)
MEVLDIIFLIITIGIGYILYSTLGKRTGHEPSEPMPRKPWKTAPTEAQAVESSPEIIAAPLITGVKQLKMLDPKFDQTVFLNTARNTFESIIHGFVKGDSALLRQWLKPALYHIYAKAIEDRNNAHQQVELAFFRLIRAEIKEIQLKASLASVYINFVSEQSQILKDTHGKVLEGDLDILDEINEIWVFERDMKSSGSNWLLAETYAV